MDSSGFPHTHRSHPDMEGLTQRPLGWATGSGGHSTPSSLPSGGQACKHVFTEAGPSDGPRLAPGPSTPSCCMAEARTILGPQFPPLKPGDCNDPALACPNLQGE